MDNKKVGITLVVLAFLAGSIVFSMAQSLEQRSDQRECNPSQQCEDVAAGLGYSHFAMGFLGAILSLGVYLIFFNTSEQAILERLEAEKEARLAEERLAILLQAMDDNEKKIFSTIAEQNGITQKTLALRTGLSKAKVSQVLSSFEKKGLVKRQSKGRTYSVFLAKPL